MRRSSVAGLATATAALLCLALPACSTGSTTGDGAPARASGDGSGFPVSVEHVYGTTTISKPPARVATLGWSDQDVALALGVAPVGAVRISWGGNAKGSTPWYDAKLAELGAKEPTRYDDADGAPVEKIAELAPDLILATNSGITKEEYTKLSKIAPVVAYPGHAWGTSWQTSLDLVGKALGREREAAKVKRQTQKAITDAAAAHPQTKGKSFIFASLSPTDTSKVDYYTPLDNRPRLLTDLGMVNAPFVEENGTGSQFVKTVSAERASSLAADVFITYAATPGEMKKYLTDPLLGQIPAFRTGGYVDSSNQTDALGMSAPSPLSIPWAMDKFVPLVAAAVDRAEQ
ncbi:iron-siderophore ABC transporter substrate-binding protein [Pedococcus sp. NPDC057267]|uniref:iron-siderophore ABC transporter substrate-binding protein n=1 Tax=Pedococcus sp. NPDC057267 TaxID=3346077 RepID=UPI003638BC9E